MEMLHAIREEFKINPSNPYAISKAALDFFASTYQKVNNLQYLYFPLF